MMPFFRAPRAQPGWHALCKEVLRGGNVRTIILCVIVLVFAPGDGLAKITPVQPQTPPGVQSDDGTTLAARRKRKKRRKKRRRRRARRRPAAQQADSYSEPEASSGDDGWNNSDGGGGSGGGAADQTGGNGNGGAGNGGAGNGGGDGFAVAANTSGGAQNAGWATGWAASGPSTSVEAKESGSRSSRSSRRGSRRGGVAGATFVLNAGYTGAGRQFEVLDNTTENVRPYEAAFVSLVGAQAEAYLLSLAGIPLLEGVGVRGGYRQAVGLASTTEANPEESYSTTWNEMEAGVTYRLALGNSLWVAGASYGMLNFAVALPEGAEAADEAPALGYTFGRLSLDMRLAIGSVSVLLGGGYRHVLSTGELGESTFPGSTAMGYDVNGGLAYQVTDFAEVRATGHYSAFVHSLVSNQTHAASGANDIYWGARAGLVVFF
jgi:hypothetical protein